MANAVEIVIRAMDATRAGFASATKNVNSFRATAASMASLAVTAAGAVGSAYLVMAKHFAESADEIGKMEQKTGIAAETLSRLKFVAQESGVHFESLQKGLKAAAGEAAKSGQTIEQFLIGNADRFSSYANGAGKAAEAQRLFGKAGQDLIPILNQGAEGLRKSLQEAEKYTTVIDSQTAATADAFSTSLGRTGAMLKKGLTDGLKEALPFLLLFAQNLEKVIEKATGAGGAVETFTKSVAFVGKTLAAASQVALNAWENMQSFAEQMFLPFMEPSGQASMEAYNEQMQNMVDQWTKLEDIWAGRIELPKPPSPAGQGGDPLGMMESLDDVKKFNRAYMDMMSGFSSGGAHDIFKAFDDQHAKRIEQIEELKIAEASKNEFIAQSAALANQQKTEAEALGITALADLDRARHEANLSYTMQALESEAASNLIRAEGQRALIDAYVEQWRIAHATISQFSATMFSSFSSNLGNAFGAILRNVNDASAAFKQFGQAMLQTVTNYVGQWLAAQITLRVMQAVFGVQAAAVAAGTASVVAAAWAPAAALASLATFGGNAGPANAALVGTVALSKGLAIGGVAHGGLDYVPAEQTYLLQKGERVIQPSQNEKLSAFLDGGGAGSSTVEVFLDGEVLARGIGRMSADGRLQINARGIV